MYIPLDRDVACVLSGVTVSLVTATAIGQTLRRKAMSDAQRLTIDNLNARIFSWWVMCAVVLAALLLGPIALVVLFGLLSMGALREFVALTQTRRADHRPLLLAFFVAIPAQYALVAGRWDSGFAVLIPVYGLVCLAAAVAIAGDTARFVERLATMQLGVMVCVYGLSYAPALLMLDRPHEAGQSAKLLLYLILVVESSDVLQYIWGKLCGRRAIAPRVSPSKTVEGLIGGVATATLLGGVLWRLTPFTPWQAALLACSAAIMGFLGGLVMSAVKRDRGVKDFGTAIAGHGGILDRVDSLCFAAPVFFHLTRYWSSGS
jgi:phosphatidate cytidylyltransferase